VKKLRWFILPLALAVLLIGSVFLTTGTARTAQVEATVAVKAVTAPTAPTLTLAISDTVLALDASATLDLGTYTTYSGTGTLTYTAETAPSELFTLTLAGQMLTITSTSTLTGGVFVVDVEVTDGVYTATDPFTVTVEAGVTPPTLTLDIPDTALALDTSATLDLAEYTEYNGAGVLTYTAETAPSEWFTLTLAGQMLTITSTSTLTGGVFVVEVDVTDGVDTATDPFTVTVEAGVTPKTLTLNIPDGTLTLDDAETLDLWTYTTYSGDQADLVYTATTPASALFAAGVTGTHYLNITSTSATMGGEFVVDVSVGDGLSTTTDAFTVTVTSAPTLSLWLPEVVGVPYEGQRTLDLWDFTTYHLSEKSGLVYTVTGGTSGLVIELADGHTMSMTAGPNQRQSYTDIEVSDGDLYFAFTVKVVTDYPPDLEFYGNYDDVAPNPVEAPTGALTYLTKDDSEWTSWPLEEFARGDGEAAHFELVGDVPPQLGAEIITGTLSSCSYAYCYYLTFRPPAGASGTYQVEVQQWNYSYMTDTDILTVTVMPRVFLPLVVAVYPPMVTLRAIDNPDGDGVYDVQWDIVGGGHIGYELQRDIDPNFTNPETFSRPDYSSSYSAETLTPGTYYWRIRAYSSDRHFAWSNVVAVNVGNFAYLFVEPLCAFGLRVELSGPINDSIDYESNWCGAIDYWRSVPAGTYTTRLTWLTGGGIVDNVGGTYLGNGGEYIIVADQRPPSWQPY